MDHGLRTPVVLIVFNRAAQTTKVFATIRAIQPVELFVIADGPRPDVPSDVAECAATRAIVEKIDWPCQVQRRFSEVNLGLRRNVSEGLDWVFHQTEQAIILEDDCLPDPSFFPFCEELLERYARDRQVGMISGTNLDPAETALPGKQSYYFSSFCHIWGWATWRRAWQLSDHQMGDWPSLRRSDWLRTKFASGVARNFWRRLFDDSYTKNPDGLNTWDVPWTFTCWRNNLWAIVPSKNLVTNLGFGSDATHTKSHGPKPLPVTPIDFPLKHPSAKTVYEAADRHIQDNLFQGPTWWRQWYWKLRLPLPIWVVRSFLRKLEYLTKRFQTAPKKSHE